LRKDPVGFRYWWQGLKSQERLQHVLPHDLSYTDLSELDLSDLDLSNRDFTGANLQSADLRGAKLSGAIFDYANLRWLRFRFEDFADVQYTNSLEQLSSEYHEANPNRIIPMGAGAERREWDLEDGGMETRTYGPSGNLERTEYLDPLGYYHCSHGPAITLYHLNGNAKEEHYYQNNQRHRDYKDGPALIHYEDTGHLLIEAYYSRDLLHRPVDEGPAYIKYRKTSKKVSLEEYYEEDRYADRGGDLPNSVSYHPDSTNIQRVRYYKSENGHRTRLHRLGAPAEIAWHEDGKLAREIYCRDGKVDRDPTVGPALRRWHKNGKVKAIEYHKDGQLHRPISDGPARHTFHQNGKEKALEFYKHGKRLHI
jgi:antitoxin component YwqK of YwqJK toxin-antitoxin module